MVYDLMLKRRSIRKFKASMPPRELLEKIVAAGIAAPSASNKQSWKFVIVTDQVLIKKAASVVRAESDQIGSILATPFQEGFIQYAENFSIFERAPVLIVPLYRIFPLLSHLLPPGDGQNQYQIEQLELKSALISVSCAIENMLLMAEDSGLGACCMTGPLLASGPLKTLFNVSDGWDIASVIPVGFPDENPLMPKRKQLNSTIKWITGE